MRGRSRRASGSTSKPVTRVENFCATGSEAFRNACYAVAAGAYDLVAAGAKVAVSARRSDRLAKMVGDGGHIYGVDIQPEMLDLLNERADSEGIKNITPVLGTFTDARLPKGKFDLILCDPPTFSHSKKMEGVLDIQRDHVALLRQCLALLAPGGGVARPEQPRLAAIVEQQIA